MLILVELDGLTPTAFSRLLKGDRVGFYRGEVFNAIRKRLIATLQDDPDIKLLESEAEEQVADLESGTDAIYKKLDELIDEQHRTDDVTDTPMPPGTPLVPRFGQERMQDVVLEHGGRPAEGPSLQSTGPSTIRMRPHTPRIIEVRATPPETWVTISAFSTRVTPAVKEVSITSTDIEGGGRAITLTFDEPDGMDPDEYPIETKLQVLASFEGHKEPRLVEKSIVISPPREPPPPPTPPVLLEKPTELIVVTRQPVKLIPGGATAHVRLRWNGKDDLVTADKPAWSFTARCTTITSFPSPNFTNPRNGRFELLIDTPRSLLAAQDLEFEIVANGPGGAMLPATVRARLEPPPAPDPVDPPGTKKRKVSELQLVPARPYVLKMIGEEKWDTGIPYWTQPAWDGQSVACYQAPTEKEPLVLMINKDYEPLRAAREAMVKKGLVEGTIEDRHTKYLTHIALHLYSMYRNRKQIEHAEEAMPVQALEEFEPGEIERMATTLLHMLS
jgi:hypothetical protein